MISSKFITSALFISSFLISVMPIMVTLRTKIWKKTKSNSYKRLMISSEKGFSLMEMLILVLILGIALPAIVSVIGVFSHYHVNNKVRMTAAHLANSRMEEILAFKYHSWDWFKSIQKFEKQESLEEGYIRKTSIQKISQWGHAKIDAYEIKVEIVHSELSNKYLLSMRLSKYH